MGSFQINEKIPDIFISLEGGYNFLTAASFDSIGDRICPVGIHLLDLDFVSESIAFYVVMLGRFSALFFMIHGCYKYNLSIGASID